MADKFPSDNEKALFREAMRGVQPLQRKNNPATFTQSSSPSSPKKAERQMIAEPHKKTNSLEKLPKFSLKEPVYLSDYCVEEVQAETILSYSGAEFANQRLRELKSGKIRWQAQLDLHGRKAQEAKQLLVEFIDQQSAINHRCLLIIHGKGNYQGKAPILKNLVNCWLPQFKQVLAFHSALARDGGSGALYVLLKRQHSLG